MKTIPLEERVEEEGVGEKEVAGALAHPRRASARAAGPRWFTSLV